MLTGTCLCGDVAFDFDGPPLRMYNCHCSRCRQAAGSACQSLPRVRRSGYRWLAGSDNIVSYQLPGTRFQCAFCHSCGSRTPWEGGGELCVPAGFSDCDPGMKPTANICTDSRAAWTVVDQSLESWSEAYVAGD